jgi:murein L,D-transpeptidase YcbB/YkuD
MNLQHEQIFRRALQSRNPQAVLNVAQIFHRMGETGKARVLIQRLQGHRYGFGADYFAVQKKLNDLGVAKPELVVDGIWGPKSKAALATYQKSKGLTADGIPGPITLGSLGLTGESTSTPTTPTPTPTSSASTTGGSSTDLFGKMKWPIIGAVGAIALIALLA